MNEPAGAAPDLLSVVDEDLAEEFLGARVLGAAEKLLRGRLF